MSYIKLNLFELITKIKKKGREQNSNYIIGKKTTFIELT